MAERIRIQKAIANAGLMSRRAAEEAMLDGRIKLNGEAVVLGDRVDLESDLLTLDGVLVSVDPEVETHLLNKPLGVISTADDPQGRQTVVDLIDSRRRLYPVGRLDADSEGLILISNDGELTHRVTHPSFGVTKTYLAEVGGAVGDTAVRQLISGVELDDGLAKAKRAVVKDRTSSRSLVEVVMVEGRNREVRRMMDHIGYPIVSLARTAIGSLTDRRLKPGESRLLNASELRKVFET